MHLSTISAAGLLTLAALIPAEANAQGAAPYQASGSQPSWSLTIDGRTIRYETPGRAPLTVARPNPRPRPNGQRYETRRLTVDVTRTRCSDARSGRQYPDTVTVTADGRTVRGCGGVPIAAASPVAGEWRVTAIAGRAPVRGTTVTIAFQGNRVSGNTGCNSFNGNFRLERNQQLTAGPLATTRRACTQRAANVQEQALLGLLRQSLTVAPQRNGTLVLRARNGQTLVLTPVRGGRR